MNDTDMTLQQLVNSPQNQCFACGPTNPAGLHLQFEQVDGDVVARFVADARHGGWAGVVHGGILTTILDEAMAYTMYFRNVRALTGRLEVRFRQPAIQGMELTVRARVVAEGRRHADVEAAILHEESTVAEGKGRFMKLGQIDSSVITGETKHVG